MILWLLDASVLLASEGWEDDNHSKAARLLRDPDPRATLDLALYEVTSVGVRAWRDRAAASRLGQRVEALAEDGGELRADANLLASAATIADDLGISVYGAA